MPFAGQGANMSIEDGECLAIILGSIHSKKDIKHALKAYDMVRLPRMAGLRQIIELNVETFGLADGEAQKARDARLAGQAVRSGGTDWRKYGSLERWKWLESYDTTAEVSCENHVCKLIAKDIVDAESIGRSTPLRCKALSNHYLQRRSLGTSNVVYAENGNGLVRRVS